MRYKPTYRLPNVEQESEDEYRDEQTETKEGEVREERKDDELRKEVQTERTALLRRRSSKSAKDRYGVFNFPVNRKLLLTLMGILVAACDLTYTVSAPFFPAEAAQLGAGETAVGVIFASYAAASFVVSFVAGKGNKTGS